MNNSKNLKSFHICAKNWLARNIQDLFHCEYSTKVMIISFRFNIIVSHSKRKHLYKP